MPQGVAIIGAGWAGLSAALTLSRHSIPVTLYEAGRQPGGRARSVNLPGFAGPLDNGQHILLGAYHQTLDLIRTVNPQPAWHRTRLQLNIAGGLSLSAPALPAPLHSLMALLNAKGLSWQERRQAIGFMWRWQRRGFAVPGNMTVDELLTSQSERLKRELWEPLCLATLNTPLTIASGQVFLNVLRDSLTRKQTDSDLIIPGCDLGALFPEPAVRYLVAQGHDIRLGTRVTHISRQDNGFLVNGCAHEHVICATAPWHAATFARQLSMPELANQLQTLGSQAIATVWLQYAAQVRLPHMMTGLTGTLSQWVFDRGQSHDQPGLVAVVISAAPAIDNSTLASRVSQELHQHLGLPAKPDHVRVICEQRATFSCTAALQRPDNITPVPGWYLAGDYTASPYPATLEAACQSGVQCAIHLLRQP